MPPILQQLWELFLDLNAYRQSGMSANPISLNDINAWCSFHGVSLTPWELSIIKTIDVVVMGIWNKPKPKTEKAS